MLSAWPRQHEIMGCPIQVGGVFVRPRSALPRVHVSSFSMRFAYSFSPSRARLFLLVLLASIDFVFLLLSVMLLPCGCHRLLFSFSLLPLRLFSFSPVLSFDSLLVFDSPVTSFCCVVVVSFRRCGSSFLVLCVHFFDFSFCRRAIVFVRTHRVLRVPKGPLGRSHAVPVWPIRLVFPSPFCLLLRSVFY